MRGLWEKYCCKVQVEQGGTASRGLSKSQWSHCRARFLLLLLPGRTAALGSLGGLGKVCVFCPLLPDPACVCHYDLSAQQLRNEYHFGNWNRSGYHDLEQLALCSALGSLVPGSGCRASKSQRLNECALHIHTFSLLANVSKIVSEDIQNPFAVTF